MNLGGGSHLRSGFFSDAYLTRMTQRVIITSRELVLGGILHPEKAPKTVSAFSAKLPWDSHLVQARWSGQSAWIPLGEERFDVGCEDPTSYPAPGELLLYPGGVSESEILFPYGPTCFASKAGQLAGNHFLTIDVGREHLPLIGKRVLWEGAQPVRFALETSEPSTR